MAVSTYKTNTTLSRVAAKSRLIGTEADFHHVRFSLRLLSMQGENVSKLFI